MIDATETPGRVHGINHIGISVRDLAASRSFWCDALGFVEFGDFSWPAGTIPADEALGLNESAAHVSLIRAGNVHLELFEFTAPIGKPQASTSVTDPIGRDRAGIAYVAIDSRDVRATLARFEALDINVVGGSDDGWLWVRDPDGNAVAIVSGPTRSGRVVDANPARESSSPDPIMPINEDIVGIDHVGIGLLGSADGVSDGVRRWSSILGSRSTDAFSAGQPWVVESSNLDLAFRKTSAQSTDPAARRACDLGYNHLCLDVSGVESLHEQFADEGLAWNHAITESSGGKAAVVYGRTADGVLVELLENRTSDTFMWCGHLSCR